LPNASTIVVLCSRSGMITSSGNVPLALVKRKLSCLKFHPRAIDGVQRARHSAGVSAFRLTPVSAA
jgi:hypothetical protein